MPYFRCGGGGSSKKAIALMYVNYPFMANKVVGEKKVNGVWTQFNPDATVYVDDNTFKAVFNITEPGTYRAGARKTADDSYKYTEEFTITLAEAGMSFGGSVVFEYPLSLLISDWAKTSGNMEQREDGAIGFYSTVANPRAYLNIPLNISGYTKLNLNVETAASNNSTIGLSDGLPAGGKSFAASETFNKGIKSVDLSSLDSSKTYYLMWQFAAQTYAYITSASLS